jgi:hypothetical protein
MQIVWSYHRRSRKIEHFGSADDQADLELLKRRRGSGWRLGRASLTRPACPRAREPLPVTSSRMGCLLDALSRGLEVLGFGEASGGGQVFRDLVLARVIGPAGKLDSLRVLDETSRGRG